MPGAVANRYAQALADIVLDPATGLEGRQAVEQLRAFETLVTSSPDLRNVLLSPAVPTVKKRAVIDRFAQSLPLSGVIRNILLLLIDRRRTDLLHDITTAFETALDERLGFVRADVVSAAPLSDRQKAELREALSRVTAKNVRCDFEVDSSLLGGVVARIGSTVYDGSVKAQLHALRQRLVS